MRAECPPHLKESVHNRPQPDEPLLIGLDAIMRAKGLSIRQAATALSMTGHAHFSPSLLHAWLAGSRPLTRTRATKLANALATLSEVERAVQARRVELRAQEAP